MSLVALILVPILFGVILYKLPLNWGKIIILFVQAYLIATAAHFLLLNMREGSFFEIQGGYDPILYISLRGDRVSLLLVNLAVFLFTLALLYAIRTASYFNKKFLMLFLILQGLLNGVFMTDDIFNLFVLIEVSTVAATALIMFKPQGRNAFDGLFYLTMQIVTMMFFLFGVAYIYRTFGVLNFTEIARLVEMGMPRESLILPFAFLMTGIALKIGFFPLFSWVSHAYGNPSAPFPVLAILSGIFVKSSIFFVIRLHGIFYPTLDFTTYFIVLGLVTGVIGAVKALAQKDIRLILAYSTVSQIGLITSGVFISTTSGAALNGGLTGLLLPDTAALYGSIFHIANHAILKSMLFLTAGMIVKEYKTSHVNEISGLLKRMPLVGIAVLIGVLGISGFPFINASISKYFMMAEVSRPMEIAMWLVNTGTILVFVKFGMMLFGTAEKRAATSPVKVGVVVFMALTAVLMGVFGTPLMNWLFSVDLALSMGSFIEKSVIYVIITAAAFLFYKGVLSKTNVLYRIAKSPTTVQQSCLILLGFFISLMLYGIAV